MDMFLWGWGQFEFFADLPTLGLAGQLGLGLA